MSKPVYPNTPQQLATAINSIIPKLNATGKYGPAGGADESVGLSVTLSLEGAKRFQGQDLGFNLAVGSGNFAGRNVGLLKELNTLKDLLGAKKFHPGSEQDLLALRRQSNPSHEVHFHLLDGDDGLFTKGGVAERMAVHKAFDQFLGNLEHIVYGLQALGAEIDVGRAHREAAFYAQEQSRSTRR